jgi:hypothetical protein
MRFLTSGGRSSSLEDGSGVDEAMAVFCMVDFDTDESMNESREGKSEKSNLLDGTRVRR